MDWNWGWRCHCPDWSKSDAEVQNVEVSNLWASPWPAYVIGASLSEPHTCGGKGKFLYICIYVWYVHIPYVCILPYLCVLEYFHMLYVSKDIAKLLRLKARKKLYVRLTYGTRRRSERLRRWNQHDRDRRSAGSAQQREARLTRRRRVRDRAHRALRSIERLACETPSNTPHWAGSRARKEEISLGAMLWKELLKLHTTTPVLGKRGDNRDYIEKGLTPYSIAERFLIPQLYVLSKSPL